MRFHGAGGNFADDLLRLDIDDVDRLGKFGADVEQSIWAKSRAMRSHWFAEENATGSLALFEINDVNAVAVGAGFAHSGIAVNRDVAEMTFWVDDDFVAVDADLDAGDRGFGVEINEDGGVLVLVGDEGVARRVELGGDCGCCNHETKNE